MIPIGPRTLRAFYPEIAGNPASQRCCPFLARPNQTINNRTRLSTSDEQLFQFRCISRLRCSVPFRMPRAISHAMTIFIALPGCSEKQIPRKKRFIFAISIDGSREQEPYCWLFCSRWGGGMSSPSSETTRVRFAMQVFGLLKRSWIC